MYTVRRTAARERLWTPHDLGSLCSLWLDGLDRSMIVTNGTKISLWRDKSIAKNDFSQATSTNQPLDLMPPALQSTGGNLVTGASPTFPLGTADRTIVYSGSSYSGRTNSTQVLLFYGVRGGTTGWGMGKICNGSGTYAGDASSQEFVVFNGGSQAGPSGSTYPAVYNTVVLNTLIATNQTATFRQNGKQVWNSAFSYNTTVSNGYLFNITTNDLGWQGGIFNLLILNTADIRTVQLVEGWLAWQKALMTSLPPVLPAAHPYRLGPPKISV